MLVNSILAASAFMVSGAIAWNKDVHQQIGYSAEQLLTPSTKSILHHILEPKYNGSIGLAASWADDYAHTTEGAFSYQWHWIDSADNPPYYCNVYYNRDCTKGGCVVSAIANQTQILKGCIARAKKGQLVHGEDLQCSYALKWVAHFLGDIAQPLHASGVAAGGNDFDVVFGNHSTELHAVWDGWIVYADANVTGFPNNTIQPFFKHLVSRIREDDFSIPTAEWIACSDPSTPLECALSWARDSNALTCDYVYSQAFNGTNLATSGYATGAFPIVELQISKAVLRLGTWLNKLVAGDYDRGRDVVLQTNPSWLLGPDGGE
ncbi:nuclease PA3 [Aureobasidium pullulans]|uniref:Nuclease PA3 n=1 Tax=Aureobasidium pullulans TaxID=5580 RepID=A0A4S9C1S3_AURPU|nr:nuclease PA3 [Aureobasidium pullulans]